MNKYQKLLLENKAWAEEKHEIDPAYFTTYAAGDRPSFLWIGCSDSRVPESEITNSKPGDLVVHRNIANLVIHTDLNLMSVLQYAIESLEVQEIIVCGHYGCGGIKAALSHSHFGMMNKWVRNIKDTYRLYENEFDGLSNDQERLNKMVELNVKEQIYNLAKSSIIQRAWKQGTSDGPHLRGCVFEHKTGLIHEVFCMNRDNADLDDIYRFEF